MLVEFGSARVLRRALKDSWFDTQSVVKLEAEVEYNLHKRSRLRTSG